MKKFVYGLLTGLGFVAIMGVSYTGYLLHVGRPGFVVSDKDETFTKQEYLKMASALTKLSSLSNVFGLDRYTALFSGASAFVGLEAGLSQTNARLSILRAVELTRKYGDETRDFNPYLETVYASALLHKDLGEVDQAKRTVSEALAFSKVHAPESYWIGNLERLDRRFKKI